MRALGWSRETVQFSPVTQSCRTLSNPMNCSTPGLPVHHQLPESTQTHVHWIGDAIQPFHPLLSPSPLAFILSQHQGLFQWVSSSLQVAKVLEFHFNISLSNEHSGLISFRMDWERKGKPLQYSCLENATNSMKRETGWVLRGSDPLLPEETGRVRP